MNMRVKWKPQWVSNTELIALRDTVIENVRETFIRNGDICAVMQSFEHKVLPTKQIESITWED